MNRIVDVGMLTETALKVIAGRFACQFHTHPAAGVLAIYVCNRDGLGCGGGADLGNYAVKVLIAQGNTDEAAKVPALVQRSGWGREVRI